MGEVLFVPLNKAGGKSPEEGLVPPKVCSRCLRNRCNMCVDRRGMSYLKSQP